MNKIIVKTIDKEIYLKIFFRKFKKIIDLFYPLASKFMSKQIFRYGFCGGLTVFIDTVSYYLSYHYLFSEKNHTLLIWVIAPYTASLVISFCLSFPVGFLLNRYVVFTQSNKRKREQFFKYLLIVVINIFFNYFLLKVFVEYFHWFATISKIAITFVLIIFSFIMQRGFSFK